MGSSIKSMRTIDLRTIDSKLINLGNRPDRLRSVTERLREIDQPFQRVPAMTHPSKVGVLGCALSHQDILSKCTSMPLLILEDDIVPTKAYKPNLVDVSYEADAIYLGVSRWGYVRPILERGIYRSTIASQYSYAYKRIYNMCSTHAIVYLTTSYRLAVLEKLNEALVTGMPFDVLLGSIHKDFTILTPNEPFFYQEGLPQDTDFILEI